MIRPEDKRFMFLIRAFDTRAWREFIPDPGLFETREEAEEYIKQNTTKDTHYTFYMTRVGKMEIKKGNQDRRVRPGKN